MAFIEMRSVYKHYSTGDVSVNAADGVSFDIEQGEFCMIVGASGAGKTTVLNILGGIDECDDGKVRVGGELINTFNEKKLTAYRRYDVGFVFQFYNLVPNLTALENVELASQISTKSLDPVRVLERVGLGDRMDNFPSQLSGGEQQRVAIARALVNKADLIIADEPTGNIDPAMSVEIMELLNHINATHGTTIVMVTHAHDLVKQYDHRVVVLRDGKLVVDSKDKDAVIPFLNENEHTAEAGYYEPPNEFEDVEAFIRNYGKSGMRPDEDFYASAEIEIEEEITEPAESGEVKDGENGDSSPSETEVKEDE